MRYEEFEELKSSGKLPTPSGVGLRILALTRSENCSLDEITRAIQADPALTGRILKLANSALSVGLQPSSNVRDAGIRLGLRTVCNVSLGFSLISGNRTGRCAAFDYDGYWSWSLANGVASEYLSRKLSIGIPGEAFTLGLLARIGRLALASVHAAEYEKVLRRLKGDSSQELALLEHEVFCINHREVAAAIAEDWGLPHVVPEVLLYCGVRIPETLDWPETKEYLRLLAAAGRLADVLVGRDEAGALWPAAREALVDLGVPREDCQGVHDEIGDHWKEWGQILRVPAEFNVRASELETRGNPNEPAEPVPSGTGLHILAVDDDPTSLLVVERLLKKEGHLVTTARNGEEALAKMLETRPQMVITDWMMPGMDGVELCKRLRNADWGKDLYILILTGQNEEERVVEALQAGADDHVAKPIKSKLLLARIRPGARVIRLQERLEGEVEEKKAAYNELAVAERKAKRASLTDSLTGLPNRRHAMKRLETEWATSLRAKLPLSVILLDIDLFKKVNDTYGHDVGDEVLRATSRTIVKVLRTSDTCARMGGEEFLVICPGTPLEGALQLADRIRQAVEASVVEMPAFTQRTVTVSLGVSCSSSANVGSIDALLKAADEAVYIAKRLGRNRVHPEHGTQVGKKSA